MIGEDRRRRGGEESARGGSWSGRLSVVSTVRVATIVGPLRGISATTLRRWHIAIVPVTAVVNTVEEGRVDGEGDGDVAAGRCVTR